MVFSPRPRNTRARWQRTTGPVRGGGAAARPPAARHHLEGPAGSPTDTQRPYNGHFRCSGASMHQGLSKPQGCRNHPTAIWPLSRPPRPNRTWRPRQGGPNGQKPALYPVSGLIPVRTCHGPKCPPAQPPSGASGPLAAAILKRGLERPRRCAGSPAWGRARARGRPLGCVARGRLRWGRGEGCWGGRQTGINLCILLAPATSGKALANALCPALCPLCGGPAASLAPRRPPKRCPDLPRSRLLKLGAARTARCGVLRRRRVLS